MKYFVIFFGLFLNACIGGADMGNMYYDTTGGISGAGAIVFEPVDASDTPGIVNDFVPVDLYAEYQFFATCYESTATASLTFGYDTYDASKTYVASVSMSYGTMPAVWTKIQSPAFIPNADASTPVSFIKPWITISDGGAATTSYLDSFTMLPYHTVSALYNSSTSCNNTTWTKMLFASLMGAETSTFTLTDMAGTPTSGFGPDLTNDQYLVIEPGYYRLTALAEFTLDAGEHMAVRVKRASTIIETSPIETGWAAASLQRAQVTAIVWSGKGSAFTAEAWQDSGGALSLSGVNNRLEVQFLGSSFSSAGP